MLVRALDNSVHDRFKTAVTYPRGFNVSKAIDCLVKSEECLSRVTDNFIDAVGGETEALHFLNTVSKVPTKDVKNEDDISTFQTTLKQPVVPKLPKIKSARPPPLMMTPSEWFRKVYPDGSHHRFNATNHISTDSWFREKMSSRDFQDKVLSRLWIDPRVTTTPDSADRFFEL